MHRTLSGAGLASLAARHHAGEIPRFVPGEMQLPHRVDETRGAASASVSFRAAADAAATGGKSQLGRLLQWAGKDLGLRKRVGAARCAGRGLRGGADVERRCLRFSSAADLRRRCRGLGRCLSRGCRGRFGCEGVVSLDPVFTCQRLFTLVSTRYLKLTFPFPQEESYSGTPLCGQAHWS